MWFKKLFIILGLVLFFAESAFAVWPSSGVKLCTDAEMTAGTSTTPCLPTPEQVESNDDGAGSGSMTTVEEGDVQVGGADIVTIDCGAGLDCTESPDTEINIVVDLSETGLGSTHDTSAELDALYEAADAAIVKSDEAKTISSAWTFSTAPVLPADTIDAITEVAAALKSGADGTFITGTAGTDTYTLVWNADGDAVDGYDPATKLDVAGDTMTGLLITAASGTGSAGLRLGHGTAPSSPVNGDMWTTTSGLYARINGGTVGPFGTGGSTAYDAIVDPTGVGLITFGDGETATYDGAWDGETAITISLNAADLVADTIGLLVTAVDNDDPNFIPFRIQDDQDGTPDTLVEVDYTGKITAAGGFEAGASATPEFYMKDSDCTDSDNNWTLGINATDTGSGTEDIDIDEQIQIAGALTSVRQVNADGSYTIGTATMNTIIAGDLTVTGDDLFMSTNTDAMLLIADGANFNPTAVSGDIAITNAGVVTIQANAVDSDDYTDGSVDPVHLANVTKSEFIPIGWMDITDGGSDPPESLYATDSNSREYKIATFDGATDEDMSFVWDVPDDFTGSDIKFMWKGIVTNATGPSAEAISFQLSCISVADGEQADFAAYGSAIAATESSLTESQDDIITSAWSAAVTPTGIAAGETVHCLLNRDADNADTYAQDFGLIGIKIKWEENPGTLTY